MDKSIGWRLVYCYELWVNLFLESWDSRMNKFCWTCKRFTNRINRKINLSTIYFVTMRRQVSCYDELITQNRTDLSSTCCKLGNNYLSTHACWVSLSSKNEYWWQFTFTNTFELNVTKVKFTWMYGWIHSNECANQRMSRLWIHQLCVAWQYHCSDELMHQFGTCVL